MASERNSVICPHCREDTTVCDHSHPHQRLLEAIEGWHEYMAGVLGVPPIEGAEVETIYVVDAEAAGVSKPGFYSRIVGPWSSADEPEEQTKQLEDLIRDLREKDENG